jgi:hypothetical protein
MIIGVCLALLLLTAGSTSVRAETVPFTGFSLQDSTGGSGTISDDGSFKWERELRSFAFHLLKDVRRWSIRLSRYVQRSAGYWFGWLAGSVGLLVFGGVVSAIDRRIFVIGWQQGARVALAYASIGVVVFLRLLRDRRVSWRLRLIVPCALLYAFVSGGWLHGLPLLDAIDELLVVGLASRWFVRRCPEEVLTQHASYARQRAQAVIPAPSEQSS